MSRKVRDGVRGTAWLRVALLLLLPGGAAIAQVISNDAGAVQRALEAVKEQQREQRLREMEEAGRRAPLEAPARAGIRIPEALRDYRFALKRVDLDASIVLTPAEIAEVRARFEGREIAFAELQQLVDALNALYDTKGVLARAVLAPQKIRDGVVRIRLVEARVADVKVLDNRSTRASYVLDRVDLPRGELLAIGALREELLDFNLRNDVNLRASLEPGAEFGTTDVLLHAIEPARWDALLAFDNAGADSVGRERAALNLTARSLTGFRDRLSAAGIFSEGSRTGSLLVDAPVGRWGTRLGAGFDASDIEIVDGPLSETEVEGDAHTLTLQASHPLIVHPAWRVDGFMAYRSKHSSTDFFGFEIADIEVRSLEYGATMTRFDPRGSWTMEHAFTSGFSGLGSDKGFLTYRGDVQRWQRLTDTFLLRARVQGQWADVDLLPPSEQFQLGGQYTVRGFREGLLIGDTGYLASVELRAPLPVERWLGTGARGFAGRFDGKVFLDHGGAFPFKGAGQDIGAEDYLTAAGFGFDMRPLAGMSASLTWSFPIGFRDDGDDYRFLFLVQFGIPALIAQLAH